jgi:excisionase family DNA binding protein
VQIGTNTRPAAIREAADLGDACAGELDRGVTVARAAELLGCDPSTVRRLVKAGALVGWRVSADPSRRGQPRLSIASIKAWRRHHKLEFDAPTTAQGQQRPASQRPTLTAAHRAAVANLKDLGIV